MAIGNSLSLEYSVTSNVWSVFCFLSNGSQQKIADTSGQAYPWTFFEESVKWNITSTPSNIMLNAREGTNNLRVYANDSSGNIGSSIIYFSVNTTSPGCIDTSTLAFYKQITVTSGIMNLDFTYLIQSGLVNPDLSDVNISAQLGLSVGKNTSGGYYLIVNTNGNSVMDMYFGNFLVNNTYSDMSKSSVTLNISTYSEINPYIQFIILDEVSGNQSLPPNANLTLVIYCERGSSIFNLSSTHFTMATKTQANSVRAIVEYSPTDLYYRDYQVTTSHETQYVYLVDANLHQMVKQTYRLKDLSGEFSGATLSIKNYIGNTLATITELSFDVESKAIVYLINGYKYQLFISNGNEVRGIGNIYVDSGDLDKLISINAVVQRPVNQGNVKINVTRLGNSIHLYWLDTTNQTNQVEMWVYNQNRTSLLYYTNANASSEVTFDWAVPNTTASYWVEYKIHSDYYGNGTIGAGLLIAFSWLAPVIPIIGIITGLGATDAILWFTLLVVMPIPLMFSERNKGIAAFAMLGIVTLFTYWGQYVISAAILGLGLFLAVLIEIDSRRKTERLR
jgi:hypothetical protein